MWLLNLIVNVWNVFVVKYWGLILTRRGAEDQNRPEQKRALRQIATSRTFISQYTTHTSQLTIQGDTTYYITYLSFILFKSIDT